MDGTFYENMNNGSIFQLNVLWSKTDKMKLRTRGSQEPVIAHLVFNLQFELILTYTKAAMDN